MDTGGPRGKRAFCLWHRRSGKDLTLWHYVTNRAIRDVGIYYYLLPTFVQAKRIIWDGITNDGIKFLDFVPSVMVEQKNASELKLTLKNGSIIQLIGTDHYDAIRGTNPIGCIFSEYAFQNPMAWEVIKPILKVNRGWAVFNTTPNGKNHAYDLYNMAEVDDQWFCEKLTIQDTNVLEDDDMVQERKEGMSEEMIQQEYYVSFDIGALGAYYSPQIKETREHGRICKIPIEKTKNVDLWLDLGRNDSTSIIFTQRVGKEIRIIDFYEYAGEAVDHYITFIQDSGYKIGVINLPHDARQKRLEGKHSVQEQFEAAGFKTKIVPKAEINSGIQTVRKLFPRMWFDSERTSQLIRAIENYHREWDEVNKVFRNQPRHDWSSHACDAIRYMAVGWEEDRVDDYEESAYSFVKGAKKADYNLGYSPDEWREYQKSAQEILK